jgi:hypothetical protein
MLAIGISGKRSQGKSAVAIALASRIERCSIISVYDIVTFFNACKDDAERDAITEHIRQTRENFIVDSIKIKMSLETSKYNVFIIDDIFDSILMNQIKRELNAQIIGVEKPALYNLPLKIRDNVASGILGEPDYIVRYSSNYNELSKEIDALLGSFKEKGIFAG